MADFNTVSQQFIQFYYRAFDENRAGLGPLYRDSSMLTFEGVPVKGAAAIVEKLTSLPFQTVHHKVVTCDAQPSSQSIASLIVSVTGLLLVSSNHLVTPSPH
ncbi:hypothetical protein B0F90DRAFT_1709666, partial [Multifurca ochricompacta]